MSPPHLQRETSNATNVITRKQLLLSTTGGREIKMLTNVAPWALIKGCGLNLLKKGVRSAMATEQEPYFGSKTIYYHPDLKQNQNEVRSSSTVAAENRHLKHKKKSCIFPYSAIFRFHFDKCTCVLRGPMVPSDSAAFVRNSRKGLARLIRSVDAGTRNTTSRRSPAHTVNRQVHEGWKGHRLVYVSM